MKLFDNESSLGLLLGRIGDLVLVNLLFLVCCIPVITIGSSLTALYYSTLKMAKGSSSSAVKDFTTSFKSNFRQSTAVWLVLLLIGIIAGFDIAVFRGNDTLLARSGLILSAVTMILLAVTALYIFPVIAAFDNTTKNLLRNSIIFAVTHFPATILMLLITGLPILLTALDTGRFAIYAFIWFFLGASLITLSNSYILMKIFSKYLP